MKYKNVRQKNVTPNIYYLSVERNGYDKVALFEEAHEIIRIIFHCNKSCSTTFDKTCNIGIRMRIGSLRSHTKSNSLKGVNYYQPEKISCILQPYSF